MTKIIGRFENECLSDDVTRVARSPLRKLGRDDRLVGPARKLCDLGFEPVRLAEGIALALQFDCADDPEAVQLQSMIAEKGYAGVLRDVCGLEEDHSLFKLVISHLKA